MAGPGGSKDELPSGAAGEAPGALLSLSPTKKKQTKKHNLSGMDAADIVQEEEEKESDDEDEASSEENDRQ